jgi:hypothetical protein
VIVDPLRGVETVSDNFHVPILGMQNGTFLKLTPESSQQDALPLSTLLQLIEQEMRSLYGQP